MKSFKDVMRWYNNTGVVPTLEAIQKMIASYSEKDINMLRLGWTLPNLAKICRHKYTDTKVYPFMEADKDMLEKNQEDVVCALLNVFARKAVVDEIFIAKSKKQMQINCWDWC